MTEHELQVTCAEFLDACLPDEAVWFAVPNGGLRNNAVAGKLKAEGVKPGVPDILIVYQGRLICIELKTAEGILSDVQIAMQDRLVLAGATVMPECRSLEAMVAFLVPRIILKGRIAA